MREYGKVFSQFWTSDDVRAMSEDARTLALYLMTCQHGTTTGVFPLPDGYVCEDISWTAERVSKGFDELFGKGFARRCSVTKWVWVLKHLEWNRPENPNQWKSARKFAERVPEKCLWRNEFLAAFALASGDEPDPKNEPLRNGFETLSKPESETEGRNRRQNGSAKPRKTRIPLDFVLTPELTTYASTTLPDCQPEDLFEQFCQQARSKGWEYVEWKAAFQTYCRNAKRDSGHFSAGQYPKRRSGGLHAGFNLR